MVDAKAEASGVGILSLYIVEGTVVALVATRVVALTGPSFDIVVALVAAVVLALWAAGWPVYERGREEDADRVQRELHPESSYRGRRPPIGIAGVLWKAARKTIGALFGAQRKLYERVPLAFRPPMALLWLAVGGAAVVLLPRRHPPPAPVAAVPVDDTPAAVVEADPYACPDGTEQRGGPPPAGREQYCEREGRVKHGPYRKWHDDGAAHLALEGHYVDGKRDGVWRSYHPSGRLANEGAFKHGEPDGRQVVFDENGKKLRDVTYKDGHEVH